jgi:hypothetical protein
MPAILPVSHGIPSAALIESHSLPVGGALT